MLTNFLEKSKPSTFLILVGLFLVYFLTALFSQFSEYFFINASIFSYVKVFILILLTHFLFNFIVRKNNLTFDNYFAFFFFIVCLGVFPYSFLNEKTLLVNLIVMLFLRKLYSLQSSKKVFSKIFDASFWLSVAFIMNPATGVFLIVLFVGIYVFQKITFQTFSIVIIGVLAPLLLFFTYSFWSNNLVSFYQLFYGFTHNDFTLYTNILFIFPALIIGLFLFFSILTKTPKTLAVKNMFRKSWILVLCHFFFSIFIVFLLKESNGSELLFVLFPTAIILANGLELIQQPIIKNSVIILFLIASTMVYFL